jgi:hypothetical protein
MDYHSDGASSSLRMYGYGPELTAFLVYTLPPRHRAEASRKNNRVCQNHVPFFYSFIILEISISFRHRLNVVEEIVASNRDFAEETGEDFPPINSHFFILDIAYTYYKEVLNVKRFYIAFPDCSHAISIVFPRKGEETESRIGYSNKQESEGVSR